MRHSHAPPACPQLPPPLLLWEQGLIRYAESFPLPNSLDLLSHAEGLQCCAVLSCLGTGSLIPMVGILTHYAHGEYAAAYWPACCATRHASLLPAACLHKTAWTRSATF
jgi:hypothetical protein